MSRKGKLLAAPSSLATAFAHFRHQPEGGPAPVPSDTINVKPRVVKPGYGVDK